MKQAGLSLIGVKITTLASFTLFEDLYTDNEQAVAFVDVRDTVTDISFVAENYFRLSRSVEFGLSNLVERLRQKLGLTHEEAVDHLYRNKVDLMESYRPAAMQTAEEGTVTVAPEEAKDAAALDRQLGLAKSEETIEKQVRDNVLRSMGQFVNELMRSIRYFESQQKRRSRVGRVVIFGYIGGLSGLAEYLAEQTALEVTVVTDVPGVEMGLDDAEQRELKGREAILVVPAGLAAEGVKRRKIEMNLIPRETVYRVKSFNALRYAAALVVILLAVLAVIYINLNKDLAQFKGQEDDLNRKIASIKPYYDKSQQFKGYNATVQGKLGSVLKLAAVQPPWPVVMDELGRVMRDSCFIDEMHFDANGYTFKIHGYVLGTPELEMFLVNLYHSDILKVTKAEDLTNSSKSKSNNTLGSRPSGGGSGGSRYSTPMPGGGEGTIAPVDFGDHSMGSTTPMRPEPMYKLPSNPNEARLIEWYFQGTEFTAPILWEFSIPGTLNTAAMQSGQDLFADLKEILGSAAAGPAKPGGGGPAPSTPAGPAPATPGAPPAGGGDSGGGT
jgi:cell division ATPase FtsA